MIIRTDDIIAFANQQDGKSFSTIGEGNIFILERHSSGIIVIPNEGHPARISKPWLDKYVVAFNAASHEKRFITTTYAKFRHKSYVLRIIKEILFRQKDPETLLASIPPEEIEILLTAPETEHEALRKSRIGQGRFRQQLITLRKACYVTRIADERFLRASHIKPWCESTNEERLDPHNGLLLAPNYDHLFDCGLISFEDDGRILVSTKIPREILAALNVKCDFCGSDLGPRTKKYLSYHRTLFGRNNIRNKQ